MVKIIAHAPLIFGLLLTASSAWPATSESGGDAATGKTVEAAREWLAAEPENRAAFEPALQSYDGNIDAVIEAITPKGSTEHATIKGEFIKGDTFVVPRLLERNEDQVQ